MKLLKCHKCNKHINIFSHYFNPNPPYLRLCNNCYLYYYNLSNSKPINISKLFEIDYRKDFTNKQFFLICSIIFLFNIILIILMWITNTPITCIGILCE